MRCHALFFLRPIPPALVLAAVLGWGPPATAEAPRPAVIAYVFPRDRILESSEIRAEKLTHVNFAFANVVGGRVVEGSPRDAENLRVLTGLRRDHPHLRILVSVGGWTWSKGFSDAALTAKSRRVFVASAVDFVRRHDLDGFDVDWEYPGLPGDGNPHRPEDKENFTALMADLRAALDREGARRGRPLLLTFAAGASREFLAHTEMAKVQAVVDFVNLMTYDFRVANPGAPAGHHANLYPSPDDPRSHSADGAVKDFLAAGVPAAEARSRRALLRAGVGGGQLSRGALQGRKAAKPTDRQLAPIPRGARRPRGMGACLGHGRPGALPLERGPEGLRDLRGRGVAAPQEPVRPGEGPRRRDVLGVPRRPHGGAPRHARRGASRHGRRAALRRLALRARSRRRGARRLLGEPHARRSDPAPRRPPGAGIRERRHGRHAVDGPDRRSLVLHRAAVRALSAARERQGAVLAPARQALRGPRVVRARGRRPAGVEGPPGRPAPRAAALADDGLARRPGHRLERQPLDAPRARSRHGRARDAPPDPPGGQPPGRGRRPQLAQRHRPHAVQLERDRGPDGAAARAARVDRGPAGPPEGRVAVGGRAGPHRQRDGRRGPRDPAARGAGAGRPGARAEGGGRVLGRVGRCLRGRGGARRGRSHLGRVLARASPADRHSRGGRRPRHAGGPLRPAGDRHAGHPVRRERPQDLPARHPRVRDLPEDRPPADRRRVLEAHRPHREGARPELDPLPLVVPAGGGLHRRGRGGLLLPGGGRLLGEQLDPPRRGPADRRVALPRDGPHPEGLRQPPVLPPPALRKRARRAGRGVPGPVGRALEGARPAPALHERLGLAADPREPVPRGPRPAHPGLGPGARVARQREAAGDADGLPRLREGASRCP